MAKHEKSAIKVFTDESLVDMVAGYVVLLAMLEMMEKDKNELYERLLQEHEVYAKDKGERGGRAGWDGHRIETEDELFLSEESDELDAVYQEAAQYWLEKGDLTKDEAERGICPVLKLKSDKSDLENAMMRRMFEFLPGDKPKGLPYGEKRKTMIHLIMSGVLAANNLNNSDDIVKRFGIDKEKFLEKKDV